MVFESNEVDIGLFPKSLRGTSALFKIAVLDPPVLNLHLLILNFKSLL